MPDPLPAACSSLALGPCGVAGPGSNPDARIDLCANHGLSQRRRGLRALGLALVLTVSVAGHALDLSSPLPDLAAAALGAEPGQASVARWREGRVETATLRQLPGRARELGSAAPEQADAEPLYEIGSISKVFTGLLLAQAVEAGELRMDDAIGPLLQGSVSFASAPVAAITLRQLVTHTSCLPRQFGRVNDGGAVAQLTGTDRAALWAALAAQTLPRGSPCPALYSNYGMAVLGELIAQRLGQPWIELVRQRITGPLGLQDTMLTIDGHGARLAPAFAGPASAAPWPMSAYAPAGGLRATAGDLVRFGRALLQGRQGPLGAAAERVLQPLAEIDGASIGHAIFVLGPPERRTWMHDGLTGGYRALLVLAPDTGEVFAALASNRFAPLPRAGSTLLRARYPVAVLPPPKEALPLTDYAGFYGGTQGDTVRFEVAVAGGTLHLRSLRGVFQAYAPVGPDRLDRPAGGARLSFERDAQGRVEALVLEQAGRRFRAARQAAGGEPARPLAAGEAEPYLGLYRMPRIGRAPVEFIVGSEAGQLIVRSSSVDWQALLPVAGQADRFRYDVPAAVQFERDASGRVLVFVLHENGAALRATRATDAGPAGPTVGRD